MADKVLDAKGLMCPMPIVKLSKEAKTLTSGQTLEVQATDPAFEADVKAWCQKSSNVLSSFTRSGDAFVAVITIS